MRSNWNGAIELSFLNLPVGLGSSSRKNELGLKWVRYEDGSKINFTRVADIDGKEVAWNDMGKGYTAPDGSLVVLSQKEAKDALGGTTKVAELIMFTDPSNVPPMAAKNVQWVIPQAAGQRVYALLASALQQTGKVGIIKYAMRDREALAVLRSQDGVMSLETLEWASDLAQPDFPAPVDTSSEEDHKLMVQVIESRTDKFDHSAYTDTSRESLMKVIQGKIERGQVIAAPTAPAGGSAPVDLTEALKASVDFQKKTAPAARPKARTRKAA